jgi:hypothetical protein
LFIVGYLIAYQILIGRKEAFQKNLCTARKHTSMTGGVGIAIAASSG